MDLASLKASVAGARQATARHFIYVSVAHPAPVMRAFIAARREGEALVKASRLRATILRPWYILGPGHRWPYVLVPLYTLLRCFPTTREGAERLGLVTRRAMVAALVRAVDTPPAGVALIVEVREIRQEREPYAPDVEHQNRRCDVLARASDDRGEHPMR